MRDWAANTLTEKTAKLVLGIASGAGVALLAYLLLGIPPGGPSSIPYLDKIQHFFAFGLVTGPAIIALARRYWIFWITHMIVLAAGSEVAQAIAHAGRKGSIVDFLADILGIAAAVLIGDQIRRRILKRD